LIIGIGYVRLATFQVQFIIATGYELDGRVRFPTEARDFLLLHSVQPILLSDRYWGPFAEGKAAGA
jgi:hypothetical protein